MNPIMLMLAILVMVGCALVFCALLKTNLTEGMFLAVPLIMLLMEVSGRLGSFLYALIALALLGIAGWALWLLRRGGRDAGLFLAPACLAIAAGLIYCHAAFRGDFIQNVDELHQYALAVKTMYTNNSLIDWSQFPTGKYACGASLFQLYFQEMAGFDEGLMYSSAFLMTWIGLLLPFAGYRRKDGKQVLLYSLVIFASIYTMYLYGYKNLYVDMPCAAWAGGLAGWWLSRGRGGQGVRRLDPDRPALLRTVLILAAGSLTLISIKSYVGALMALFVLAFALSERLIVESGRLQSRRGRLGVIRFAVILVLVLLIVTGALYLYVHSGAFIETVRGMNEELAWRLESVAQFGAEKNYLTFSALLTAVFARALSTRSNREVTILMTCAVCLVLLHINGRLYKKERENGWRAFFFAICTVIYLGVLYVSFITMFTAEEAEDVVGVRRYLTIIALFQVIPVLTLMLRPQAETDWPMQRTVSKYLLVALGLFFLSGFNKAFIWNSSALNSQDVRNSVDIQETAREAEAIASIIGPEDRVYFINQSTDNEFPQNVALYCLGNQVSNYLSEPWCFNEQGSMVRIAQFDYPSINELYQLIENGNYTYVWIYKSDKYLRTALKEVTPVGGWPADSVFVTQNVGDCQLYRVIENEWGGFGGLEFVAQLNNLDLQAQVADGTITPEEAVAVLQAAV